MVNHHANNMFEKNMEDETIGKFLMTFHSEYCIA